VAVDTDTDRSETHRNPQAGYYQAYQLCLTAFDWNCSYTISHVGSAEHHVMLSPRISTVSAPTCDTTVASWSK
jgi:hypothetical protein